MARISLCRLVLAISLFAFALTQAVATPPSLPREAGWDISVPLDYPDADAVRKAWKAIEKAMPPVDLVDAGPRKALALPLRFEGNDLGRMAWDGACALDLSGARSVFLRLYCDAPLPVGSITVYLRSGAGYYWFKPPVPEPGAWRDVEIQRMDMAIEGKPGPWSEVSSIRVSPWRGSTGNGTLYLADVGVRRDGSSIAFLRNDEASRKRTTQQMTNQVKAASVPAQCADALGIDYRVVSDLDFDDDGRLAGVRVLVLPYAPNLSASVTNRIVRFLKAGGKLIAFYSLPKGLYEAIGIRHVRYQSAKDRIDGIVASENPLGGMPRSAMQQSWNLQLVAPVAGRSRVVAWWRGKDGAPTEWPAVVASDNGIYMSHLLLNEDRVAKEQMFLSMIGTFLPETWKKAAEHTSRRPIVVGSMEGLEALEEAMAVSSSRTAARKALAPARKHRDRGRALYEQGRYPEVFGAMRAAEAEARGAWCAVQTPRAGERRAFWAHHAYGPKGMDWDAAIKAMAENGFNMILPNTLWGGVAYYPSKVLPVSPEVAEKGDAMKACVDACRRYGVECHAWKVHWRIHKGPKAFREKMRSEGRVQAHYDGKVDAQWLCPSHPANRKMEVDSMVEVARLYGLDGVHSDYIRFPTTEACYCPTCRAGFEKAIGRRVANWPADTRNDSQLGAQWDDFRRNLITTLVRDISQAVHALPGEVEYSAAVFPNWPVCRNSKFQDWKVWCERGYLDFICPMDYREDSDVFRRIVTAQKEWVAGVPSLPGIGLSVWRDRTDAVRAIEQIRICRELGLPGFTIFHLDTPEATRVLPLLGLGITRPVADKNAR